MKKVLYFAALLFLATACEKEDIENTAAVSMAGQWYCTVDAVDDAGNPITQTLDGSPNDGENYFGLDNPRTLILTYNTAGNSANEMWVDNMGIGNLAADYADYWKNYGFFPTYTIKAKVSIANTQETVNKYTGSADKFDKVMGEFEKMEQKADKMLDIANAKAELEAQPVDEAAAIEAKYQAGMTASVDDELAKLKEELGM